MAMVAIIFKVAIQQFLYDGITQKLFSLSDDTLIYQAHDYNGRQVSKVKQEKMNNPRLASKSHDEFIHLMQYLNFPKHKHIDIDVYANRKFGVTGAMIQQGSFLIHLRIS